MPHVTCAFSTFGEQNVIPNGCQKSLGMEKLGKATENRIEFEILSAVRLTWWVNVIANLSGFYVAVVLFMGIYISPSVVRDAFRNLEETTSSDHVFPRVTLNGQSERDNTPGLIAILYLGKRKRFVERRRLESPSLLCFINQLRGERRL